MPAHLHSCNEAVLGIWHRVKLVGRTSFILYAYGIYAKAPATESDRETKGNGETAVKSLLTNGNTKEEQKSALVMVILKI